MAGHQTTQQGEGITATYTRTRETMQRYINEYQPDHNPFTEALEKDNLRIKDFEHWFIMDNEFPYDSFSRVSHMICTKRKVAFDWNLLTQEEKDELNELKQTYIKDNYDVLYENLPSGQTKPGHFHLHLLILKRTGLDEFMNKEAH